MSQTVDRTVSTYARTKSVADRLMDEVIENTISRGFDPDAWHVMDQRDTRLIQDEIMGGPRSSKFIYDFSIQGTNVSGISAIGARELMTYYGGIQHRLVSSTRKVGSLFVFTTYPHEGVSASMQTTILDPLKDEPDGFEAVCEVHDIKTANRVMAAKFESQWEKRSERSGGGFYEKPHFATIAQSKAQRNGILQIIPQAVQLEWIASIKKLGGNVNVTAGVLDEKRDGVLRYCAAQGIPIDRDILGTLLLEQIMGLSEAARTGARDTFMAAAVALRLVQLPTQEQGATLTPPAGAATPRRRREANAPAGTKPPAQPEPAQRTATPPAPNDQARADPKADEIPEWYLAVPAGAGQWRETTEEPFIDRIPFAQALSEWCRAHPDDEGAIMAENADAISWAREMPEAAAIIEGKPGAASAAPSDPHPPAATQPVARQRRQAPAEPASAAAPPQVDPLARDLWNIIQSMADCADGWQFQQLVSGPIVSGWQDRVNAANNTVLAERYMEALRLHRQRLGITR